MTAHFQYGGFVHPDWQMNLMTMQVRTRVSPRGMMLSRVMNMHLRGEIQTVIGTDDITSQLNAILDAYYVQNQDAKFFVNGSLTPHQFPNGESISGNKVMQISHPFGDGSEYANRRTIDIVIQSEFEDPESQLVQWDESVQFISNTGPRDEWFQGFVRARKQRICKRTVETIIQAGSSIGWAGYALPLGPLLPLSEHQEQRTVRLGHPRCIGQALRLYPCSWSYTFQMDNYTETAPNIL